MIATLDNQPAVTSDPPGPGIYPNVPDTVYHSWDICSNSRLNDLNTSPEYCAMVRGEPKETKDEFRIGSAVHTLTLEPELFDKRHAVFVGEKRSNDQKALWKSLAERVGEGNILRVIDPNDPDKDEHAQCLKMRGNVMAYPAAAAILSATTARELSIIYDVDLGDGRTLRMKARIDAYAQYVGGGLLGDLKSGRDVSELWFAKAFYDRGYFRQLANYKTALAAFGLPVEFQSIIAVQNTKPFTVRVYEIETEDIELGEMDLLRLMREYHRREESGDWQGNSGRAVKLGLSSYARKQIIERS